MKIKEIRMMADAEKKTVPSGCDSTAANGPDKPPC